MVFELAYVRRVFPGYVLEREDTREGYGEPRFRDIGKVLPDILGDLHSPGRHLPPDQRRGGRGLGTGPAA